MPVLWHSGKRDLKKTNFFPECLNYGTRQRVFKKNSKIFSECCTRGRKSKKKENDVGRRPTASSLPRVPARHSAKPSPSARFLTLGEGDFSRERISRRLFPECCTRRRLTRVQLGLPRVQLALGESSSSCRE